MIHRAQFHWDVPKPVEVNQQVLDLFPGTPVIAEILHRRGLRTVEAVTSFLDVEACTPADPFDLPGMRPSVQMILDAIHRGVAIGICGDYDTDGLTSTAILYAGLLQLTPRVTYQIPDRGTSVHGISMETMDILFRQDVGLVITCDTGVSENDAIRHARELGMDVIVTDHHALPEIPANANQIVNPLVLPPGHLMSSLSGAGVAYKLIEAVYHTLGRRGEISRFSDLAAVGILGDMVPLTGEARFLVQRGLQSIQAGHRPGIREVLRCASIPFEQATEKTITQILNTRINSLSRLFDAAAVIDLLTTGDDIRAGTLARQAEEANTRRKQQTDSLFQAARGMIENDRSLLDKPILYLETNEWHFSVLGMVASQLSELYARPAVIVSSFDKLSSRGSARSVPGIDITSLIKENAQFVEKFGGHAMAAGFSIKNENLLDFKRALMATVARHEKELTAAETRYPVDAVLPLWDTTKADLAEILNKFRPFGPGNGPVNFLAEELSLDDHVLFGKSMQHRRLTVTTRRFSKHTVIWWNSLEQPGLPDPFDMVYQLVPARPDASSEMQIILAAARKHESMPGAGVNVGSPAVQVLDWRARPNCLQDVTQRANSWGSRVFAEGIPNLLPGIQTHTRLELSPCAELILLTLPASYDVLRAVLEAAAPQQVIVAGLPTGTDQKTQLMAAVTRAILDALKTNDGRLVFRNLAAATGQTEQSMRLAVDWLVSQASIRYRARSAEEAILERSGQPAKENENPRTLEDLERSLEETASFKRSFQKADLERLFAGLDIEKGN